MDTDVGNRLYASCSSCGHVLGCALSGSDNEVRCPKCGAKINYKVAESIVTVTLLEPSTKKPSQKTVKRHLNTYSNLAGAVNQ